MWTEDDVRTLRGAMANRNERSACGSTCWLYTGLRRGDAVQLGRQHVRDGVATIRTEKTGVTVTIPILPTLAATLAAGPCGELGIHLRRLSQTAHQGIIRQHVPRRLPRGWCD